VLEVEELRVGADDGPKLRDLAHPADVALALDLDPDRALVERVEVFLTGSRRHRPPPVGPR
jgi:hypothetical protein